MFSFFKTQLGFGTVGLTEAGRKKPALRAYAFAYPNGPHSGSPRDYRVS